MAKRERINPQTGKKEYKARYFFWADGRRHEADTGWFPTKKEAEKAAERLKEAKEKAASKAVLAKRETTLEEAFTKYIVYLEDAIKKGASTSYVTYYKGARTMKKTYFPEEIRKTKMEDITSGEFKTWFYCINDTEKLGGERVRAYRLILYLFNEWLDKYGYYVDSSLFAQVKITLRSVKIVNIKKHNKEDEGKRSVLTLSQVFELLGYFAENGLGTFENFYWYVLFHVLIFSGVRVEELVALQFKHVNWKEWHFNIENAISEHESEERALERVKKSINRTKTASSEREMPILDYYRELLVDYKESYRYQYGLSETEIEEAFIFPNLVRHDAFVYQRHKNILRKLNKVCEIKKLPKTDSQMMRHTFATLLASAPPDGFGYEEKEIKDMFGHTSTKLLETVYAKLGVSGRGKKGKIALSSKGLFTMPEADAETAAAEKKKQEQLDMIAGKNVEAVKVVRKARIFAQIAEAEKRKQPIYYYNPKDKDIVEEYKATNTPSISFEEAK